MSESLELTDLEGNFLSLVLRVEPVTTYQMGKIYAESPVSSFGTAKGTTYPIIHRLEARGLLAKRAVPGNRRGAETLECTDAGREAVRQWVLNIRDSHMLLDDPLRTKVQSLGLLTDQEKLQWVLEVKARMHAKLAEIEGYGREVDVPFKAIVHDNAVSTTRSRLDWLDRMLIILFAEK